MTRIPALVIGGGPAGAACAAFLAKAGRRVLLIEAQPRAHHKVCGEFVSEEAALYLGALGMNPYSFGAVGIDRVRLCRGGSVISRLLPLKALSLSRRVLDEAVLDLASRLGAEIMRGLRVNALSRGRHGWIARLDDGAEICAAEIFLATGKHDLVGWKRSGGRQNDLVAFKLHWRLSDIQAAALDSAVELVLFPGGYAGLQQVEDGIANLCLVIRKRHFLHAGRKWAALLSALRAACPHLAKRLEDAQPCWDRPLATALTPYGFVQTHSDGLWRLGDQAAVIPPFSGDGMAIALHSARFAARCYLTGASADNFQAELTHQIAGQINRAMVISQSLVRPIGQAAAIATSRTLPFFIPATARLTRISPRYVDAELAHSLT